MAKHRADPRPLPERTQAQINGCAALGLSFWALHPTPGHVLAVHPVAQTYHVVRIVGGTAREIGTYQFGDERVIAGRAVPGGIVHSGLDSGRSAAPVTGYPDVVGHRDHDGLVLL